MTEHKVGAVVIGRNEGQRLGPSLVSVRATGLPMVYVDSGSIDASVNTARPLADAVVELDPARPFTAARARNEGLAELRRRWPQLESVLFLDGDCLLEPGFVSAACSALAADGRRAVVTGHLLESHPDASIFNRLCQLEWRSPAADAVEPSRLGGIMVARIDDVLGVGGFNEAVIAGEDSELAVRIGLAGKRVAKIDVPMAVHDADIHRFSQWWRRAVRAGHAIGQRYALNGRSAARDCARELRSTLVWGAIVPLVIVAMAWPTRGLSLVLIAGYFLIGWRIYAYYRGAGASRKEALLGARFGIYSKFANAVGLAQFALNRLRGRFSLIEYK